MAIRIKNNSNGRTIIVKNQDDMFNLKNTGKTFDFDDNHEHDPDTLATYDLSRFNDEDIEDYINSFSFDPDASTDSATDLPLNPQRDPYFDFGSDQQQQQAQNGDFDIDDDSDFSQDDFNSMNGEDEGQSTEETDEEGQSGNPDLQGQIRSVTGAVLVYKRQNQDGTYNELWVYTVGKDVKSEYAIRRAILSGTDVDPNTQESDDGSQRAVSKTVGNVQFIQITGLPQ
jgi:hypothetical protein